MLTVFLSHTQCRAKRLDKMDEERLRKMQENDFGRDIIQKIKIQEASTSKALHKIAVQRLQSALEVTNTVKDVIETRNKEALDRKQRAESEFASDIAKVEALIATQAEKHVRKVTEAKKRLNDEKDDMLRRGLNPYVEFRKKEFDEEAKRREKRMKDRVDENKTKLVETLFKEDEDRIHREAEELRIRKYEQAHRAEQGRHLIEEKNMKYIQSKTIGNRDILDPTGRLHHVFPSKVTEIPDHSFGLGKSSRIPDDIKERTLHKVQAKLGVDSDDVGEYDLMLRSLKNHLSSTIKSNDSQLLNYDDNDSDEDRKEDEENLSQTSDLLINQETSLGSSSRRIKVAELSKFEQDSLQRARDKHKQRIEHGEKQIVNGRTYTGKGFVAKPNELIFQDFEVGKTYRKRFTITNASYSFNSFKILDFDADIADIISLVYDRPGRMSAGVSCQLEIVFKPQYNEDVITSIQLLCDTGPTEIPVKCLIKRCAPVVANTTINLGNVIIGQQAKASVKIMNSQAIETEVNISRIEDSTQFEPLDNDNLENMAEQAIDFDDSLDEQLEKKWLSEIYAKVIGNRSIVLNDYSAKSEDMLLARTKRVMNSIYKKRLSSTPYPIFMSKYDLYLNGYDSINAEMIGEPLKPGKYSQDFLITFPQVPLTSDVSNPIQRERVVSVSMSCDRLPIEVTTPIVDMKCCYYARVYRQHCQLHNHGKVSYRVNVKIDDAYATHVDINPTTVIIQAHETTTINIKFSPSENILQRLSYFSIRNTKFPNTGAISLPIKLEVQQQSLPLYFSLRAILTSSTLTLSTKELNFGDCYIHQQSIIKLTIKNPSILPQKIAFTKLRKEVCVSPNDGFAVLLPNDEIDFDVAFTPLSAIPYNYEIDIVSSTGDHYPLRLTAYGKEAGIGINQTVFNLQHISPGERLVESAILTNTSNTPQIVEILLPETLISWIRVSPYILELQPSEKKRIEIEYQPPIEALDAIAKPKEWYKDSLLKILKQKKGENPQLDEKCMLSHWEENSSRTIASNDFGEIHWVQPQDSLKPCILGQWSFPVFFQPSSDRSQNASNAALPPLFLQVSAAVISPQLEVSTKLVEFGNVLLGTSATRRILITNRGSSTVDLSCPMIDVVGPFSIRNALRPIAPGASLEVILMCQPKYSSGVLTDSFEFRGSEAQGGHSIRIQLRCQAVSPIIEVSGIDAPPYGWSTRGGLVNFGDVVVADTVGRTITVTNTQSLSKSVRIQASAKPSSIFSWKPDRFEIPAAGSQVVEISFKAPSDQLKPYREEIDIMVGKQDCIRVGLTGRAWNRQTIVKSVDPTDDPLGRITHSIIKNAIDLLSPSRSKQANVIPSAIATSTSRITSSINEYLQTTKALEFNLTYADMFSPSSHIESALYSVMNSPEASPTSRPVSRGKANLSKQASMKAQAVQVHYAPGSRRQTKKLLICSIKIHDNRKAKAPGSFEIILSQVAKASNRFQIHPEKGTLSPDNDVLVDLIFIQPPPVVSEAEALIPLSERAPEPSTVWMNYEAEIILKGGWVASGEANERRVPIILRAPAPSS
jgi:hypothetical protein